MRRFIVFTAAALAGLQLQACGRCGDDAAGGEAPEAAMASPVDGAASTTPKVGEPEAVPAGVPDEDGREALLKALLELEVPGMSRSRATRNGDLVTLQFDTTAANASGNYGTVEVVAGFCVGCTSNAPAAEEVEARIASLKEELGEPHSANPDLRIELGELELAPARMGATTYRKSFIANDDTRATVHTLATEYLDANRVVRLFGYPRTGTPETLADFEAQYTRAELDADQKRVFAAVSAVLWPSTKL
jgi:hypothetical protein